MTENLVVPSLVDAVYAAARDRILTGDLAAGTRLTEKDVAETYDVARPTAKAALERLVSSGLLRRTNNKTARVPSMTATDIADLYYSRGFLEREVMLALAKRKRVPQAALDAMERIRHAIDDPSLTRLVQADVAFHQALVDSLESPRLSRMYASIMGEAHLCMAQVQAHRLLHPTIIASEHEGIMTAIKAGNGRLAVRRINAHLERARSQLLGYVGEMTLEGAAEPETALLGPVVKPKPSLRPHAVRSGKKKTVAAVTPASRR